MLKLVLKDFRRMFVMKSLRITWLIYPFAVCVITFLLKLGVAFLDIFNVGIDPSLYTMAAMVICFRIPLIFIGIVAVLFVLSDENETEVNYAAPLSFYYKRFFSKLICLTIYIAVFFVYLLIVQAIIHIMVLPEFSEVGENFVSIFSFTKLSFLKFMLDMYLLHYAAVCFFYFIAILTRYKECAVIVSVTMSIGYIGYLINVLFSKLGVDFDISVILQFVITRRISYNMYGYSIVSDLILSMVYIIVSVGICLIITKKRLEQKFTK